MDEPGFSVIVDLAPLCVTLKRGLHCRGVITGLRDMVTNLRGIVTNHCRRRVVAGQDFFHCLSAAGQVEAGVVPVAGQGTIVHCAPVEWEPHVGASIVDGRYLVTVCEQADVVAVDLDRDTSGCLQFGSLSRFNKPIFVCPHGESPVTCCPKAGADD